MSDPSKPPDPASVPDNAPPADPPVPAPSEPAPPPVPVPAPAPAPAPEGGTVINLTSRALKERLDRSAESARKAAEAEMVAKAATLGYASVDDMVADLTRLKAAPSPAPEPAPPAPHVVQPTPGKTEDNQVAKLNKKLERDNKRLKRRVEAAEARAALVGIAVSVGIKDPDYAVTLMTRALDGKTDAEVAAFDQRKFFANMRGTHPFLFGDTMVPLTTGPGASAPPVPAPGPVIKQQGEEGQVDVKKMKPAEYQEHLRRRGINPNALMS